MRFLFKENFSGNILGNFFLRIFWNFFFKNSFGETFLANFSSSKKLFFHIFKEFFQESFLWGNIFPRSFLGKIFQGYLGNSSQELFSKIFFWKLVSEKYFFYIFLFWEIVLLWDNFLQFIRNFFQGFFENLFF